MEVIYGMDTLSSEKNISTTPTLETSIVLGWWEEGSVFYLLQKLGEFLQLSGSLVWGSEVNPPLNGDLPGPGSA